MLADKNRKEATGACLRAGLHAGPQANQALPSVDAKEDAYLALFDFA